MTVSIRASLIFSALGMAALTAAFANPPASKSADTAIARCDECLPALPPTISSFAPAAAETKRILPAAPKQGACAQAEQDCGKERGTTPADVQPISAGPS